MKLYRHMILALALSISIIPVQAIGWPTSQAIKACLSRPKELLTGACHIASSAGKSLFAHKIATTALATACAILSFSKTRNALLLAPFRASFALARRINNPELLVNTLRLALWSKMDRVTDLRESLQNINLETTDNDGNTPLHYAACHGKLEVVQALIDAGANKEAKKHFGLTSLHLATTRRQLTDLQMIIGSGGTPLHLAAIRGHLEVVRALVAAGANKDAKNHSGYTPLHLAAIRGHLEVVRALVAAGANKDAPDHSDCTPLHWAAANGQLEVVRALVAAGANKEAKDFIGYTPLKYAALNGHLAVVQTLVAAGTNKEATDNFGRTPLHWAAFNGKLELVQTLVAAGANKEAQDNDGRTPLHDAALNGHLEVVQTLVAAGANIATQNHDQQTALDIAQANGTQDVANYLSNVPQLASNLQKAVQERNLVNVEKLLKAGAPVTMPDEQGNTVIHLSIGDYERTKPTTSDICARTLLQYAGQAALTLRNAKGQTPLHIAAQKGNCWIAECLLRRRPDLIAEQDNVGNTPLHYAKSTAMRDKLLRHGADISLINHAGQTPLSRNPGTWQSLWLPDQNLHSTPNATLPL